MSIQQKIIQFAQKKPRVTGAIVALALGAAASNSLIQPAPPPDDIDRQIVGEVSPSEVMDPDEAIRIRAGYVSAELEGQTNIVREKVAEQLGSVIDFRCKAYLSWASRITTENGLQDTKPPIFRALNDNAIDARNALKRGDMQGYTARIVEIAALQQALEGCDSSIDWNISLGVRGGNARLTPSTLSTAIRQQNDIYQDFIASTEEYRNAAAQQLNEAAMQSGSGTILEVGKQP